jgi:hypothetical protein
LRSVSRAITTIPRSHPLASFPPPPFCQGLFKKI